MCTWLLVEDNPGDVLLVKTVLADSALPVALHVAPDGQDALAFLRQQGAHATAPLPDLILLDINLPVKNGFAVLMELKRDGALKRIPVVMWSGSTSRDDTRTSYDLGASAYVKKPAHFETYRAMVKTLFAVWCEHQEVHSP
jgi:chemotaxis family two-component system response regulator Rcp1